MTTSGTITVNADQVIDLKSNNTRSAATPAALDAGTYVFELTQSTLDYGNGRLPVDNVNLFFGTGTEKGDMFKTLDLKEPLAVRLKNPMHVYAYVVDQFNPDNSGSATVTYSQV